MSWEFGSPTSPTAAFACSLTKLTMHGATKAIASLSPVWFWVGFVRALPPWLSGIQRCHMKLADSRQHGPPRPHGEERAVVMAFGSFWMAMGHSHVLCELIAVVKR